MGGIFISYRRNDSAPYAGRLRDRLSRHFGAEQVFRDIDTIAPGERFAGVIEQAVGSCDALLALIGPNWLAVTDNAGRRRLDDPDDYVRLEIAAALGRPGVLVIPVLIGNTSMPAASDLPTPLAALVECNAVRLTDENWDDQVTRLTAAVETVVDRPAELSRGLIRRGRIYIAGIAAAALAAVLAQAITGWMGNAWRFIHPEPPEPAPIAMTVQPYHRDICNQDWMVPQPPESLPPPPRSTDQTTGGQDWLAWAEQVKGVPVATKLLLTVQGRTDAQVTITNIRFNVIKREPVFAGTKADTTCGAGAGPIRLLEVNLDEDPPQVDAQFDASNPELVNAPTWERQPIRFPYKFTVSKSEAETFLIDTYTENCDCTWTGQVEWTSLDREGSLPIDNNGAPFRTTSSKLATDRCLYVPVGQQADDPWNCRPCSGPPETPCYG
jgi:hypothetical protein